MKTLIALLTIISFASFSQAKKEEIKKDSILTVELSPLNEDYLKQIQKQLDNFSNPEWVKEQISKFSEQREMVILNLFKQPVKRETLIYKDGKLTAVKASK